MFVYHWNAIWDLKKSPLKFTYQRSPMCLVVWSGEKWIEKHIQISKYYKANNLVISSDWNHVIFPFRKNLILLQLFIMWAFFLLVIYCIRNFFPNLRESKISFTNTWKRFVYRHGSMFIFSVKTFLKITHRWRKWTEVESLKNRKRKATKEINWFWGTICD